MTIYERIRELASEKGMSIRELENSLGFSNGLLRSWNKSTNSASLEKVANYFNVSTDYLLGRTNKKYMNENQEIDDNILERALDSAMSYDGKGISDADRPIIKNFIKAYLESKTN
ncbi:helix-turn-helix domain-containing protein [Enterococcus cecorum]|uniref:helix-turn-helix domain-containing protein n=1 Tax=Enterococcus cecorum TaxID=44008 RepID=UPI001FAC7864|nr:helix-turn-helix transcriptional regulator [Enterococcus cecorum]MCJ0536164.1 helix-turn-helix domain-containing protein [Enterococcus cecorum]MCJ0555172.1 helix-turn-helix domain-containing protein [Enterococcus cecorum]